MIQDACCAICYHLLLYILANTDRRRHFVVLNCCCCLPLFCIVRRGYEKFILKMKVAELGNASYSSTEYQIDIRSEQNKNKIIKIEHFISFSSYSQYKTHVGQSIQPENAILSDILIIYLETIKARWLNFTPGSFQTRPHIVAIFQTGSEMKKDREKKRKKKGITPSKNMYAARCWLAARLVTTSDQSVNQSIKVNQLTGCCEMWLVGRWMFHDP